MSMMHGKGVQVSPSRHLTGQLWVG
jgi:hypothetical protein